MKTMKTMKTIKTMKLTMIMLVIILTGCMKDNPAPISSSSLYDNGYFVTNEGQFMSGNGSISFVNSNGNVENNIFENTNSFPLGDVVQSMNIIDDKAYIVVNASGRVEVVSADSMSHITTINLGSPRYITSASLNKAYVSDWNINGVQVIDLLTHEVTSTISCGVGPEAILVNNGYAYVCNVGGWSLDNTISVIDVNTDVVVNTISVGDKPNSLVVDANGAIWVLSGGYTEYDPNDWSVISQTAGSLVKIVDDVVEKTLIFSVGESPKDLLIDESGTKLYFSNNGVFTMNISDSQLPTTSLINRNFYGLGNSSGYIYGTNAGDYVNAGYSVRYTENGTLLDSIQVGVAPGGYFFN